MLYRAGAVKPYAIMVLNATPRFARDAVILLDQIHLRFSCLPFYQRQIKNYERHGNSRHVYSEFGQALQKENYE
jgi:hypothetical protein